MFPRLPMTEESIRGNTLWYCNLHNLGVNGMRTFWWGYGTGVSLTGSFHANGMIDTPLYLGGSENTIFGTDSTVVHGLWTFGFKWKAVHSIRDG